MIKTQQAKEIILKEREIMCIETNQDLRDLEDKAKPIPSSCVPISRILSISAHENDRTWVLIVEILSSRLTRIQSARVNMTAWVASPKIPRGVGELMKAIVSFDVSAWLIKAFLVLATWFTVLVMDSPRSTIIVVIGNQLALLRDPREAAGWRGAYDECSPIPEPMPLSHTHDGDRYDNQSSEETYKCP
jgi:hypothetical protein